MRVAGPAKHDRTNPNSDSTFDDLTKKRAWKLVGGLSNTSKMPCSSWGLSPKRCLTGAKLTAIPGSVCHDCYARKGYYCYPRVREAHERRLTASKDPQWIEAMSLLINEQAPLEPYFRWFDSGDLQSTGMLRRIAEVARTTPEVSHWLPTKEHDLVEHYLARYELPENLVVRLSAHHIDEPAPEIHGLPTSTVHKDRSPFGVACPAYERRPVTCGDCRSCWNPTVRNVSYRHH